MSFVFMMLRVVLSSLAFTCPSTALQFHSQTSQDAGQLFPRISDLHRMVADGSAVESENVREYIENWRAFENNRPPTAPVPSSLTDNISLRLATREQVFDCPEVTLVPPDEKVLDQEVQKGLVYASPDAKLYKGKQYVFITGGAYTGTTGVLGLLSTSHKSTNLCGAQTICCEGSWLMGKRNETKDFPGAETFDAEYPGDPSYPKDWKDVVQVFDRYWDQSKTVFLDKSPAYLLKFTRAWKDLRHADARVSFVYIVNSPCTSKSYNNQFANWTETATKVLNEITELREAGARVHLIKNEDLGGNPYAVVRGLLDFLPELGSLDPTKSGVHDAPYVKEGDSRAQSLVHYVSNKKRHLYERGVNNITKADAHIMNKLGYTKKWFKQSSFIVRDNSQEGDLDFLK